MLEVRHIPSWLSVSAWLLAVTIAACSIDPSAPVTDTGGPPQDAAPDTERVDNQRQAETEQGASPGDPCAALACRNGGVCEDGICDCEGTGFEGTLCDLNIDDCTPALCLNGGRCVDAINKAFCDCSGTGFQGAACEDEATLNFVDVTEEAGLDYRQSQVELIDGSQYHACSVLSIAEQTCALVMSGGAAAGDYDGDGRADVCLSGVPGWSELMFIYGKADSRGLVASPQSAGVFASQAAQLSAKGDNFLQTEQIRSHLI